MTGVAELPVVSVSVAAMLRKITLEEAKERAQRGDWFFHRTASRFVSHIQEWEMNVTHETISPFILSEQEVKFDLAPYSSVYEVSRIHGYSSSILLAKNLEELIDAHMDIAGDLELIILNQVERPLLLGNRKVFDRLILGVPQEKYFRTSLNEYMEGRVQNV